jgi:hypothetical protein
MGMPVIKSIVYDHVLNFLFSSGPASITADNISSSLDEQIQEIVHVCLNPLMLEIRNRLPSLPVIHLTGSLLITESLKGLPDNFFSVVHRYSKSCSEMGY